jgi:hypothetical protein
MKGETLIISVARDFSKFPAGRFNEDGDFSGQRFREQLLIRGLSKAERVIVELDGTAGYGSSFLEEAFGGLVRLKQYEGKELHERLVLKSIDASLTAEIWEYIDNKEF